MRIFEKKAFTLVELLVVIAIVTILAAFLLPVLKKARDLAVRTSCASRQRQLATAAHLYADDYSGDYYAPWVDPIASHNWPGGYRTYGSSAGATGWTRGPGYVQRESPYGSLPVWRTYYSGYLDNLDNGVSICPDSRFFQNASTDFGAVGLRNHNSYSYHLNAFWNSSTGFYAPWSMHRRQENASSAMVSQCQSVMYNDGLWRVCAHFNESNGMGSWDAVSSIWPGKNIAFGDAHVKWIVTENCYPISGTTKVAGKYEASMKYSGKGTNILWVVPPGLSITYFTNWKFSSWEP